MAKRIVTASMEQFARTGRLGPIALGITRSEVMKLLGRPPDWSINLVGMGNAKGYARSPIWKYGTAELYFEDEKLWLIHFDDCFKKPRGGGNLRIRPWILREGLNLPSLRKALHDSEIEYEAVPSSWNPGCVRVMTRGNVYFLVQVRGERNTMGLRVFGCCRSDPWC